LLAPLLPYAVALGVESAWARSFAGVFATPGVAVASWYAGNLSAAADPTGFANHLSHGLSKMIAAAA